MILEQMSAQADVLREALLAEVTSKVLAAAALELEMLLQAVARLISAPTAVAAIPVEEALATLHEHDVPCKIRRRPKGTRENVS